MRYNILVEGDSIMQRVALVKNGVVDNVIIFPELGEEYDNLIVGVQEQFAEHQLINCTDWVDETHPMDFVSPGFSYNGTTFVGPEVPETGITEEDMERNRQIIEADALRRSQEVDPAATPAPGPGDNN